MSNTERQRRFRERHPGYYKRLHARRRAEVKAYGEMLAREKLMRQIIAPPMPLCLPAPEQVTPRWADKLIYDITSAAARRADAAPTAKEVEQAPSRDAA